MVCAMKQQQLINIKERKKRKEKSEFQWNESNYNFWQNA